MHIFYDQEVYLKELQPQSRTETRLELLSNNEILIFPKRSLDLLEELLTVEKLIGSHTKFRGTCSSSCDVNVTAQELDLSLVTLQQSSKVSNVALTHNAIFQYS